MAQAFAQQYVAKLGMELPDLGVVTLHCGSSSGAYIRHKITREIARLPATPEPSGWTLSFTADGFAFASHPGLDDAVWASDLFNLSAATVDDKGLVILDGVSVSTYHEFLKLHRR